jgi:hypothetical protein
MTTLQTIFNSLFPPNPTSEEPAMPPVTVTTSLASLIGAKVALHMTRSEACQIAVCLSESAKDELPTTAEAFYKIASQIWNSLGHTELAKSCADKAEKVSSKKSCE